MQATVLKCPECGSDKVFANGHRDFHGVEIQRFKCGNPRCGYRFSFGHTELKAKLTKEANSQQNVSIGDMALAALEEKQTIRGNRQHPKRLNR